MSQTIEAEMSFPGVNKPPRGCRTPRRIDRKGLLSHHHTRPLNSLKNILGEHARVYRSVINGTLSTIEGVRLSFILREVRFALEAVNAETARIEAAAAAAVQVEKAPLVVNVLSVPEGHYYHPEDGTFSPELPDVPQLEHSPPEPESAPIEPEPTPARPSLRLVELEHELSQLTDEELLRRVADVVPR